MSLGLSYGIPQLKLWLAISKASTLSARLFLYSKNEILLYLTTHTEVNSKIIKDYDVRTNPIKYMAYTKENCDIVHIIFSKENSDIVHIIFSGLSTGKEGYKVKKRLTYKNSSL